MTVYIRFNILLKIRDFKEIKMNNLPDNAEKIEVQGSDVDFYTYEEEGTTLFQFDSSMTGPPSPMVNAMCGLNLIDGTDKKLVMINHKPPMGLFPKIEDKYNYEIEELSDGKHKITFTSK